MTTYDAVVVGSGPNGLGAAIRLAQAGQSVLVIEGKETTGGGTRTQEITLPGFKHDICSAVHPLGLASPFLGALPLEKFGLEWIQPDLPLAHPLEGGNAVAVEKSLSATAAQLGKDGKAYEKLMAPLVNNWEALMTDFLGPLPLPPKHILTAVQFGVRAVWPATWLAKALFREEKAQAVFAGMAAHAIMPLEWVTTAAFGLMLGVLAHSVGWPIAKGGSQSITDAMVGYFKSLGGDVVTGSMVKSEEQLPPSRCVLFDVTPKQLIEIAGSHLAPGYRRQLGAYRYGGGVCKVDWALSEPIPWKAEACRRAGTVHIGGTLEEISASERAVWESDHYPKPFVLLVQPSLFDCSRAPGEQHTAWAYCHVPHGSHRNVSQKIEEQIERFAPGFKNCVLTKKVHTAVQMETYNPNYVGGDINGGVQNITQLFSRPVARWNPYIIPTTGNTPGERKYFLCSSSTPPGGGVHGMCGFYAAETVLKTGG